MTRARALHPMLMAKALLAATALALGIVIASSAWAQQDNVLAQARAQGIVGEQADGFLGFPPGANVSADIRARVDQINIRRRAVYTERAAQRNVTINEMAAAVACEILQGRVPVGERYRDESGQWRTHAAGDPVQVPSFCPQG
ncbi:MAG: YdbL family protein [Hyphomonadaceae bacterium]